MASVLRHHRSIVFLGDSNMRYQYLSFARFLHTGGHWPLRSDSKHPGQFTVCHEASALSDRKLRAPSAQALNAQYDMRKLFSSPTPRDSQFAWKWATFFNQSRAALSGGDGHEVSLRALHCPLACVDHPVLTWYCMCTPGV